jgi:3-dehydroquinate dehydratase/shikimate dehydrogenase
MFRPLVCATVAAPGLEALRQSRDAASATADLVELRLDRLAHPDVRGALAGRSGPVLVTCRPAWEGGGFTGSEVERFALLEEALSLGAEYVDVEWRAGEPARSLVERRHGRGIVLSLHDFDGVPGDLQALAGAMSATRAEVVKVAVTARRLADTLPLLSLGRESGGRRLALVAMGAPGVATRILAARFGSCWTYAGEAVAPGQIPLAPLLETYRFRSITASTAVYGILGRPVGHSVSPAMHNAAFDALGIDAVYLPFEAESVEDFRQFALALDVRGASVTAPFKTDLVSYLARADRASRRAGAANTIRVKGDEWEGRNTDVEAFLHPLRGRVALDGLRVALVGAGGVARAAAAALAGTGARVTVHARRPEAAAAAAEIAGGRAGEGPPRAGQWDLLVNATPVGTYPAIGGMAVDPACLGGGLVYDLVYNPPMTALRLAAEAAGCPSIGGLDMLIVQAARQFEWWTGIAAPLEVMRHAAERLLAV